VVEFRRGEGGTDQTPPPPDPQTKADVGTPGATTDDLTDDEIERVLKHERAKGRIEEVVNGRLGNRLQQERARIAESVRQEIAAEAEQWKAADDHYHGLQAKAEEDPAFKDWLLFSDEADAVAHRAWLNDYTNRSKFRNAKPATEGDVSGTFVQRFNEGAAQALREIIAGSLPIYGDLPKESRDAIEAIDPSKENWLEDALKALSSGLDKHIEKLNAAHKAALDEAVRAGRNDAIADREERSPVAQTTGDRAMTWAEAQIAYADGRIDRAEFSRVKTLHRINY
ncbi:MAG: hypothetical protein RLZZ200_2912, partial [Pseudomonadota bacterium]